LTQKKGSVVSGARANSEILERGLPIFFDNLIAVLRREEGLSPEGAPKDDSQATTERGQELSRLDYTIAQVVYGYGAICQAITEMAKSLEVGVEAEEFGILNRCLDKAIAEAVTEFERARVVQAEVDESKRLGFLTHELRNALTAASLAYHLVQQGGRGPDSSMGEIVTRNLGRMQNLIDGALSELRLNVEPSVDRRPLRLLDVVEEVEATAVLECRARGIHLSVEVDPGLQVNADRQCLISALANLVQNAMKFTKPGTGVTVRGREDGERVVLEVEDRCGGLSDEQIAGLFKPFTQKGKDRSGCGLGLAISRRAIMLNDGDISIRSIPEGCVFTITLPKFSGEQKPVEN